MATKRLETKVARLKRRGSALIETPFAVEQEQEDENSLQLVLNAAVDSIVSRDVAAAVAVAVAVADVVAVVIADTDVVAKCASLMHDHVVRLRRVEL